MSAPRGNNGFDKFGQFFFSIWDEIGNLDELVERIEFIPDYFRWSTMIEKGVGSVINFFWSNEVDDRSISMIRWLKMNV